MCVDVCPLEGSNRTLCCFFADMREASRRLSQSLFDVYEVDWAGEEDLGAIVEVRTNLVQTAE